MEEKTKKRPEAQDELLEKIYIYSEKTRKYFLWMPVIALTLFVLPFIRLIFVMPKFFSIYTSALGGF